MGAFEAFAISAWTRPSAVSKIVNANKAQELAEHCSLVFCAHKVRLIHLHEDAATQEPVAPHEAIVAQRFRAAERN